MAGASSAVLGAALPDRAIIIYYYNKYKKPVLTGTGSGGGDYATKSARAETGSDSGYFLKPVLTGIDF